MAPGAHACDVVGSRFFTKVFVNGAAYHLYGDNEGCDPFWNARCLVSILHCNFIDECLFLYEEKR